MVQGDSVWFEQSTYVLQLTLGWNMNWSCRLEVFESGNKDCNLKDLTLIEFGGYRGNCICTSGGGGGGGRGDRFLEYCMEFGRDLWCGFCVDFGG